MKSVKRMLAGWVLTVAGMVPGLAAAGITYYHNDIAGSPVVATNESGQVVWRESYRPYGERTVNSAAALPNKVWFTSRRQDAETGLVYMGARYYDPVVGRFVSKDPVGFDEGNLHSFNRYAYANNNPYRYNDPDGRLAFPVAAAVGLLAGSAAVAFQALPDHRKQELADGLGAGIRRLYGMLSEGHEGDTDKAGTSGGEKAVPLPEGLVGDQSDRRAGPNKGDTRHTSGPLAPEHGGTGDFAADLDKLTGGTRPWQPGDKAPPGSLVGANGIFGRPNSSGGKSIDIPANGNKPHETLHYP